MADLRSGNRPPRPPGGGREGQEDERERRGGPAWMGLQGPSDGLSGGQSRQRAAPIRSAAKATAQPEESGSTRQGTGSRGVGGASMARNTGETPSSDGHPHAAGPFPGSSPSRRGGVALDSSGSGPMSSTPSRGRAARPPIMTTPSLDRPPSRPLPPRRRCPSASLPSSRPWEGARRRTGPSISRVLICPASTSPASTSDTPTCAARASSAPTSPARPSSGSGRRAPT